MTGKTPPPSGDILWNLAVLLLGALIYALGTLAIYHGGSIDPDAVTGHIVPFRPPLYWYQPQDLVPRYISTFAHWAWGAGSIAVVIAAVALSLTTRKWRPRLGAPDDGLAE